MNEKNENPIVRAIGEDIFWWMAETFDQKTRLRDLPDELLERLNIVDLAVRNYEEDVNSITAIALITFAYKLVGAAQRPHDAMSNIALLKVLAKNEKAARLEERELKSRYWAMPLYELITGEVGERIRGRFPAI